MIVNAVVVDYVASTRRNIPLPEIIILAYIGAHTESLTMVVISSKVKK
jgi:hypothetical protein